MNDPAISPRHLALFAAHMGTLLVGQVVAVGAFGVSTMPAMMSVMMFDAPGSDEVIWTQLLAFGFLTLPVMLLVGAMMACVPAASSVFGLVRRKEAWTAWSFVATLVCFALPLVNVVLITVGGIGLDVYCDGNFNCR